MGAGQGPPWEEWGEGAPQLGLHCAVSPSKLRQVRDQAGEELPTDGPFHYLVVERIR